MFSAGVQEPITPFVDVVGKVAKGLPEQIAATGLKVAVIGLTMIFMETIGAH